MRLDYVYEGLNEYFKFINPNEESIVDVESVYNLIYEMEPTFKRCKYELLLICFMHGEWDHTLSAWSLPVDMGDEGE